MTEAVLCLACGVASAAAGLLVVRHRREHPAGWLLLLGAGLLLAAAALLGTGSVGALGPAASTAARVLVAVLATLVMPWCLLCYPAGAPAGRGERGAAVAVTAVGAVLLAALLTGAPMVATTAGWTLVVLLVALLWWRAEGSSGDERRALLWLGLGLGAAGLVVGQVVFLAERAPSLLASVVVVGAVAGGTAVVLACAVAGLLAPRAVDVRRLTSQVVRYLVSAELVLALFMGVLAGVEVAGLGPLPPIGTGLLAVALATAFHPASLAVQRLFDALIFGDRADPVAVLSSLGAELAAGGEPLRWAQALREALGAARVELWADGTLLSAAGQAPVGDAHPTRVPLRAGDDEVGALLVVPPGDHGGLADETAAVLALVAPPLAQALQGVRLTAELATERAQALGALEEERRRLRRDLHDGLGPVLTGIAYTADAARNVMATDPAQADALLAALREDTAGTIAEVRRLVQGLRPPALDERGLVGAVRQRVERLRCADGRPLRVEVAAAGPLGALPAAVEVAAYRIAVEAVTNAARHAGPSTGPGAALAVCVRFAADARRLVVTVTDDAPRRAGSSTAWVPGVGLTSMRERCEQLHGVLTAGPGTDGGRVEAVLALPAA